MVNLALLNIGDTFTDAEGTTQVITNKFIDDKGVVVGVAYQPVI